MVSDRRNGIYRLIVLAFGLMLAGAHQPTKQDQASDSAGQQQTTTSQAPSPSPTPEASYRAYPNRNSDACYDADTHDNADLCAQWRAAIAAEKAAHEARRATNWAIVATILSALGVFGLISTILQTHGALGEARRGNRISMKANARATRQAIVGAAETAKALDIAERNAEAATAQVQITQDMAKRQLMPYVYIEQTEPARLDPDSPFIHIKLKNFGQTPAVNMRTAATFRRCKTGEARYTKTSLNDAETHADIPPSHTQTIRCPADFEDWPGTVAQIMAQAIILVIRVRVSYSGLGTAHVWRDFKIIYDHMGPRQPQPSDNLKGE